MIKKFIKERIGTIIVFLIVIVFVIVGYFKIQEAKSNAITFRTDYLPELAEINSKATKAGEYKTIAQNDTLELLFETETCSIQVIDHRTGKVWKSVADNEVYNLNDMNKSWRQKVTSPIHIQYNDLKKRDSGTTEANTIADCGWYDYEFIDNGVSVRYGFTAAGIFVTVEYTIEDDELVVRVPFEKVEEHSKFALASVDVLPLIGACGNDEPGYVFYPDGSGAITSFERVGTRPKNIISSQYDTYTNLELKLENLLDEERYARFTAAMPVLGMKCGDDAIFGYAANAGENVGIYVYTSGTNNLNLNRLNFRAYMRNAYKVNQYAMTGASGATISGKTITRVDKLLLQETKEFRYTFLHGDKANYSGMAEKYRDFLLSKGGIKDVINDGDVMPLSLKLLMGATKEGMVFDSFIRMTSFENVEEILTRLNGAGVESVNAILFNWVNGFEKNLNYWPAGSSIGGSGGLKKLEKYISSNPQNNVFLTTEVTMVNSRTSGISEKDDIVYDGLDKELAYEDMDGVIHYFLNPLAAARRNSDFLKKISKVPTFGVAYEELGKFAYPDYNKEHKYTKAETVDVLTGILNEAKNLGRKVAVSGGNDYTYGNVDFLYDLYDSAFGLVATDFSVPFVEMVLSGYVPFTTCDSGNLSYDLDIQKLEWIENGAVPNFTLTYESALELRETSYDTLFSSTYDDWEDTVISVYREFLENFGETYGHTMVSHEIITEDIKKVTYDNGISIYLNYAVTDAEYNGITIPAKGYTVVKGGKQ